MAESKIDLSDDFLNIKSSISLHSAENVPARNDEEKSLLGFLEESKDQLVIDNNIPLSPQWLYSKPYECKDARVSNSMGSGNPSDVVQKENWRLDGPQDKREWRKNQEVESARRWREEERETVLLGRRERRKEGERDEHRKSDRRVDGASARETIDARSSLQSSDRWYDPLSRSSGYDARRDSKWSSRWGPEDKDKDSKTEKKSELDKEDSANEKMSGCLGTNRTPVDREVDTRDRWRPRHRQEGSISGTYTGRVVPGSGSERASSGFAYGRGRGVALNRLSPIGVIGAVCTDENEAGFMVDAFRYPRGKLLDIYRKQKPVSTFESMPDLLEEGPVTQGASEEPLAFVAPSAEEEVVLEDIWKGKVTTSVISCNPIKDKTERLRKNDTVMETEKSILHVDDGHYLGKYLDKAAELPPVSDGGGMKNDNIDLNRECLLPSGEVGSNTLDVGLKIAENDMFFGQETSGVVEFLRQLKLADSLSRAKLPSKLRDVSCSNVDSLHGEEVSTSGHFERSDIQVKQSSHLSSFEELSLLYRDPQGEIQGPFLAVDIISWFDQGFFGTDLPVCLSDAPEGTTFQELGEVIPYLKYKARSVSLSSPCSSVPVSGCAGENLTENVPIVDVVSLKEQKMAPHISNIPVNIDSHANISNSSLDEAICTSDSASRNASEYAADDGEEILYFRRPDCNGSRSVCDLPVHLGDQYAVDSTSQLSANKIGEGTNDDLRANTTMHPFGLLWSELENITDLRHTQHNNGDARHFIADAQGMHLHNQYAEIANNAVPNDKWCDGQFGVPHSSANGLNDLISAYNLSTQDSERLELERLLLCDSQKLQLPQQNIVSNSHAFTSSNLRQSVFDHLYGSTNSYGMSRSGPSGLDAENPLFSYRQNHEYQELQFQQHQLHHQQQLLLHHQQEQLKHRQQLVFEQLMQQQREHHYLQKLQELQNAEQMHLGLLHGDHGIDQVLLRQRLLSEMRQQLNQHQSYIHDANLEQLIQTKYNSVLQHDSQRELLELMSHGRPRGHQMFQLESDPILLSLQHQQQQQYQQEQARNRLQEALLQEERRLQSGSWVLDQHQLLSQQNNQANTVYQQQLSNSFLNGGPLNQFPDHLIPSLGVPGDCRMRVDQDISSLPWRLEVSGVQERDGKLNSLYSGVCPLPSQIPSDFNDRPSMNSETVWSDIYGKQLSDDWHGPQLHSLQQDAELDSRESTMFLTPNDGYSLSLEKEMQGSSLYPGTSNDIGDSSSGISMLPYCRRDQPGTDNFTFSGKHGSFDKLQESLSWQHANVDCLTSQFLVEDGRMPFGKEVDREQKLAKLNMTRRASDLAGSGSLDRDSGKRNILNNGMNSCGELASLRSQLSVMGTTTDAGVTRHFGDCVGNRGTERSKQEMLLSRSGDADVLEMLIDSKNNNTVTAVTISDTVGQTMEALDVVQGAKSGKKKGKKGRQIDPALLGFKVSSNRVLMGEIQRPDD